MRKRIFSKDAEIKALKPAGDWYEVRDTKQRGLLMRIGPKNAKGDFKRTFAVVARFNGSKHPSRRALGEYPAMSLAKAREKAEDWRKLAREGKDPAILMRQEAEALRQTEEAARQAKARQHQHRFELVAERYIAEHLKDKRRGKDDEREIRRFLISAWRNKAITDITPADVKALVKPLGKRTPAQAHIVLNHIKRIYAWTLNDEIDYGIMHSPAALLKPKALIGERRVRDRVLTDDELFAYWRAAGRLSYPMGDLYRMVALTGTRISEASDAEWPEFNFRDRLWVIPSARFKSEQQHLVPLSDRALALLGRLPTWKAGNFLFTTTAGKKPVGGFSKPKERLDRHMLQILRAIARKRGDDAAKVELEPFVIHDVRRTVRTRLSGLKVDDKIAELVIGHGKRGLARVYDHEKHLPEMSEALERWADRLVEIAGEPTPKPVSAKVVKLKRARAG